MGAGITVWNVWDLPVWAWRSYCRIQDEQVAENNKQRQEASRRGD